MDSDIEGSDGEKELTENENEHPQSMRIRVGNAILSREDEAFVEGESDEEDAGELADGTSNSDIQWNFTAKNGVKWCPGVLKEWCFDFEGLNDDSNSNDDYSSPLEYFMKYVPASLLDDITYTNIYAQQKKLRSLRSYRK